MASIRFAVKDDVGRVSDDWRLRASSRRPEVFIEQARSRAVMHFSIHPDRWFLRLGKERKERHSLDMAPTPLTFGSFQHALSILVHRRNVTLESPRDGVYYYTAFSDDLHWRAFDIFLEAPDSKWPPASPFGDELVGRLALPDGRTVAVKTMQVTNMPVVTFAEGGPVVNSVSQIVRIDEGIFLPLVLEYPAQGWAIIDVPTSGAEQPQNPDEIAAFMHPDGHTVSFTRKAQD